MATSNCSFTRLSSSLLEVPPLISQTTELAIDPLPPMNSTTNAIVTAPPATLNLNPFYKKYISLNDFAIISSDKVDDRALLKARSTIQMMTAKRPEILTALTGLNVKHAVIDQTEVTTDIPEYSDLTPKEFWDARARGLGPTRFRPIVSSSEENLLRLPTDPYRGEDITLHEFAHAVEMAIVEGNLDATFSTRLNAAYQSAVAQGLWINTYAATNPQEYWAEGVQSWFNDNLELATPNGVHGEIDSHYELRSYDPTLAQLISEWFNPPTSQYRFTNLFLGENRSLNVTSTTPSLVMELTNNSVNQAWTITSLENGTYRITNTFSGNGTSLDTYGTAPNSPYMGTTGNYSGQYWRLNPIGNGYYRLTNLFLGDERSLDTQNNATNDPMMATTGNFTGQFWKLEPIVKFYNVVDPVVNL